MTLQEVTEAHSRRISSLHQQRDAELRDASADRDAQLRALPAAARLYQQLDKDIASAVDTQGRADARAAASLASALDRVVEERSDALSRTQLARKAASLRLLEQKRAADADAEAAYRDALAGLDSTTPLAERQKTMRTADERRRVALAKAAEAYASGIAKAQADYRADVDEALADERTAERRAEQTYEAAVRVAKATHDASVVAAERELRVGLERIPEAAAAMRAYDTRAARIRSEAAAEEERLFERFREELRELGVYA